MRKPMPKKRLRVLAQRRIEGVEMQMRMENARRQKPGKGPRNVTPVAPRSVTKRLLAGGWYAPHLLERTWFTPSKPKPPKRRERRRPSKPR